MNIRQQTLTQGASIGVDRSRCEQEPIHIPGAIQPHGAMLAALVDSGRVTHASANLFAMLGCSAEAALGQPLQQVIGEAAARALQDTGLCNGLALRQRLHVLLGPDGDHLHLCAFRSGPHLCIDIEPMRQDAPQGQHINALQSVLETFQNAVGPVELCELAVRGLKAVTGYDRVIAYRFGEDGHGEVIAEARESHLESVLGFHYPAADIPPQARRQYWLQRVGVVADSSYRPVLLLTDPVLSGHTPLDLTHSALRSVSPIHREYMRNMDIAASVTVGLAHGPSLWGMLVCHHATPRVAGFRLRAAADIIGQVVSLLLDSLSEAEALSARFKRNSSLRLLVDRLSAPVPLIDAFAAAETELLNLVGAAGAVVRLSGQGLYLGRTPPPLEAERAFAVLQSEAHGEVLAVDDLSLRYSILAGCADQGSGALLLPLAGSADDAILWFRPALAQKITWGGNPAEHATSDPVSGRVSPRASFAAWEEILTGRSAPWADADLAIARELRSAVITEVAKRTKAELFELRHYDLLTGLPNRRLLQERLAEVGTEAGATATLLFLDLDGTKEVNEAMGHAAGDALLVEMARRLVAAAGPENFAARLGGDEFVVLCRDLQPGAVDELREHILCAIKAPIEIFGRLCHVSPDIGTAVVDRSIDLDLVGAANFAMQAARITIEAKHKAEAQRQKMERIGQTMGGVAHEINNMLQPVTLLVQDVIDNELVIGDGKEYLGIVLDCSKKARQIMGDLLAFSRPTVSTTEIHDPIVLLHDSLPIVRQAIPSGLILSIRIEGCLPLVKINRTTFVQILLNLAINAAAAMNGQGELTIALEEDVRGLGGAIGHQTSYARLRVIDNGCGMDKATLDRAFEPFFTTKPVGQGTGLGLPVVYGLVREMGATIALASEPGCGTTVTILIPGHNGE
jgi:diguanylate cyclase (GGDEF)-like protein